MKSKSKLLGIATVPVVIWFSLAPSQPTFAQAYQAYGVATSAQMLWQVYHRNELAGDQAYEGKRIQVGGVIRSIGRNPEGNPCITLWPGIQCNFSEEYRGRLAGLAPHAGFGVIGTVVGMRGSLVILKDCQLR